MNLKELNYIVTIADEGSISRAAEKLYMAQSSLSQFLQLYEAELGAPLFMRTSRGVRPTASGPRVSSGTSRSFPAAASSWGSAPSGAPICCLPC